MPVEQQSGVIVPILKEGHEGVLQFQEYYAAQSPLENVFISGCGEGGSS